LADVVFFEGINLLLDGPVSTSWCPEQMKCPPRQ
jgi:hypothetical protein